MLEQIVDHRFGQDRRVKTISFRIPDRRLGFPRRQHDDRSALTAYSRTLAAYRNRPRALATVLAAVAMLNIADLVLTVRALELGAAELNPIMAALLNSNLLLAATFKVTIGFGVVASMWTMRRYRLILEASVLLLGGFTLLTVYSLTSLLSSG